MKTILHKTIIFCSFLSSFHLYSQITQKEEIIKEKIIDQTVIKPEKYDSLTNWVLYENQISNNKKNIGLQIYLAPKSYQNFKPFLYSTKPTLLKEQNRGLYTFVYKPKVDIYPDGLGYSLDSSLLSDTYFTIINVFYGPKLDTILRSMVDTLDFLRKHNTEKFSIPYLSDEISFRSYNGVPYLLFLLKNNKNNDSLYLSCTRGQNEYFISVPYFLYQKKVFEKNTFIYDYIDQRGYPNKSFICEDDRYIIEYENDKGYKCTKKKEIVVDLKSKWFCSEVTLLKPGYILSYIMKNDNGDQIILNEPNEYDSKLKNFISEKDFIKRETEKKLQKQQLYAQQQKEKNAKETKEKLEIEKHKAKCISLFGKENGGLIAQGKIKIGMTQENCIFAWGEPFNKRRIISENNVVEIWNYWSGCQLSFINGKLIKIIED